MGGKYDKRGVVGRKKSRSLYGTKKSGAVSGTQAAATVGAGVLSQQPTEGASNES